VHQYVSHRVDKEVYHGTNAHKCHTSLSMLAVIYLHLRIPPYNATTPGGTTDDYSLHSTTMAACLKNNF
jgi:hypothetical protein